MAARIAFQSGYLLFEIGQFVLNALLFLFKLGNGHVFHGLGTVFVERVVVPVIIACGNDPVQAVEHVTKRRRRARHNRQADNYRNAAQREFFLSGLRLAMSATDEAVSRS